MSERRRLPLLLAGVALLLILSIGAWLLFGSDSNATTAAVKRGPLEVTIETVGRLRPRSPLVVRSEADGAVQTVAVKVGDQVETGDIIVALDPRPFEDAIRAAERQVEDAEAALQAVEEETEDKAVEDRVSRRLLARQRVDTSRRALEIAREQIARSLIVASGSGTVTEVAVAERARIPSGAPVATIVDLSDLLLSVEIDEIDFPLISVGMPVSFRLDAYPGTPVDGSIVQIAPAAQTTGGATTFPTSIEFLGPEGLILRPGMNADVSIKTAVRNDVLLVPERALRTVGRRSFVVVVDGGNRDEREIETGLRSKGMVEVASGLAEGDRVLLR